MTPTFQPTLSFADDHEAAARPRFWQAPGRELAAVALFLVLGLCVATLEQSDIVQVLFLSSLLALLFARLSGEHRRNAARRAQAAADGLLDPSTKLYNQAGLARHGRALQQQAHQQQRPLSVVLLDFSDLAEVHEIYGSRVGKSLLAKVVLQLEALAGARGLAARTGKAQFMVVLPGLDGAKARLAVQRVLGKPCRVEFDAGHDEIVLVPDVLVDDVASQSGSFARTCHRLCQDLASLRDGEQRRQDHLRRERERHSRPMGLVTLSEVSRQQHACN